MIFKFDPNDFEGMCKLMDEYGDSDMPFGGVDEDGNHMLISVNPDNITTQTFQSNGWTRTNVFGRDGVVEELYERP